MRLPLLRGSSRLPRGCTVRTWWLTQDKCCPPSTPGWSSGPRGSPRPSQASRLALRNRNRSVPGHSPVMPNHDSSRPPKGLKVPLHLPPPGVRPKLCKERGPGLCEVAAPPVWSADPHGSPVRRAGSAAASWPSPILAALGLGGCGGAAPRGRDRSELVTSRNEY